VPGYVFLFNDLGERKAADAARRRFLLGYGAAHGAMWRACCAAIERCGATPAGLADMVAGAVAGFAAFEDWFTAAEA
jgi:heme oxygenase